MAEVVNNENVALEEDLSEQMIIRREKGEKGVLRASEPSNESL